MKSITLTILSIIMNFFTMAQTEFQKGYLINNNNERIECLIQNLDWKNNPSEFKYKISSEEATQKSSLLDTKEFGIQGFFQYVRKIVDIDRSSDNVDEIEHNKNPKWVKDTLFLKVVLAGSAVFYSYEQDNYNRFFYSTDSLQVKQLVYKRYIVFVNGFSTGRIAENAQFRQQLWTDIKCATSNINTVTKLRYNLKDLEKYFASYNQCKGDSPDSYTVREKKNATHFWVNGGITNSSASATRSSTRFDAQLGARIGMEIEKVLPGNNNKWSISIEPSYYRYNSSVSTSASTFSIKINSIEFPIGVRHYFHLRKDQKLFLNVYYTPGFSLNFNSSITLAELRSPVIPSGTVNVTMGDNIAFGGGINFKKIKAEIRYFMNRSVIEGVTTYAEFKRVALTISYLLPKKKSK